MFSTYKLSYTITLCIGLLCLLVSGILFSQNPAKFPADDGFFYLQIASNYINKGGLFFHDISQTNGFHPLWQGITIVLSYLVNGDKALLSIISGCVQIVFFLLTAYTILRLNSNKVADTLIGLGCLAVIYIGVGTLFLTEAFVTLLLLTLVLVTFERTYTSPHRRRNFFIFGLVLGATFLSRLDYVFVLLPFVLLSLYSHRHAIFSTVGLTLLAGALVSLPYILWNTIHFNHIVPISGAIKSHFPNVAFSMPDKFGVLFAITSLVYLVGLIFFGQNRPYRIALMALSFGSLLHFLYNAFYQSATAQWYWGCSYLATCFLIADVSSLIKYKGLEPIKLLVVILLFVFTPILSHLKLNYDFNINKLIAERFDLMLTKQAKDPIQAFAEQLGSRLPAKTRLLVYDAPGKLAYYSDLNIIPSDGLMNDYEYQQICINAGIKSFIKTNAIQYILTPYDDKPNFKRNGMGLNINKNNSNHTIEISSVLYDQSCGTVQLTDADQILTAPNFLMKWQPDYSQVALWKIPR